MGIINWVPVPIIIIGASRSDAPSIEQGVIPEASALQELTRYVDEVVSTVNPAISEDGSNASDTPSLK